MNILDKNRNEPTQPIAQMEFPVETKYNPHPKRVNFIDLALNIVLETFLFPYRVAKSYFDGQGRVKVHLQALIPLGYNGADDKRRSIYLRCSAVALFVFWLTLDIGIVSALKCIACWLAMWLIYIVAKAFIKGINN